MFPPDPARPAAIFPFDAHRIVASGSTFPARARWGEVSCHGAECPISYVCRPILRLLDNLLQAIFDGPRSRSSVLPRRAGKDRLRCFHPCRDSDDCGAYHMRARPQPSQDHAGWCGTALAEGNYGKPMWVRPRSRRCRCHWHERGSSGDVESTTGYGRAYRRRATPQNIQLG